MREMINMYRILIAKPEEKKPLARCMEDNTNIKSVVILDVALRNLIEVRRRFGETCRRLHGGISQKKVKSVGRTVGTSQCFL
jgi:hypothetical protein